MENQKFIEWSIKEIKELEFFVNESLELGPMIDTTYTVNVEPVGQLEQVNLTIAFSFVKNETKELVMKSTVKTGYLIKDMNLYTKKIKDIDNVDLPDPIWYIFLGIAFTHARAIMARSSAGSKFSHLLMPPINPEIEFKKLFGKYLENTNSAKP